MRQHRFSQPRRSTRAQCPLVHPHARLRWRFRWWAPRRLGHRSARQDDRTQSRDLEFECLQVVPGGAQVASCRTPLGPTWPCWGLLTWCPCHLRGRALLSASRPSPIMPTPACIHAWILGVSSRERAFCLAIARPQFPFRKCQSEQPKNEKSHRIGNRGVPVETQRMRLKT